MSAYATPFLPPRAAHHGHSPPHTMASSSSPEATPHGLVIAPLCCHELLRDLLVLADPDSPANTPNYRYGIVVLVASTDTRCLREAAQDVQQSNAQRTPFKHAHALAVACGASQAACWACERAKPHARVEHEPSHAPLPESAMPRAWPHHAVMKDGITACVML
eukprot:364293-Chlamydomonas_euryale.AAC.3